jgi:Na+-transporting NADH:ubiquinone oxidoreductase subunit NqrB
MLFRNILTYRLAHYYLAAIVAAAVILSLFGLVHQNPLHLVFSALLLLAVCWSVNWIFARSFSVRSANDSKYISALILTLILTPVAPTDIAGIGFLAFAAAWAMASKYMLAVDKRHIFNPAAFGAALVSITVHRTVSWWVGDNAVLLPVIIAGGVLILTRLRYYALVASFATMVLAIAAVEGNWASAMTSLSLTLWHSVFFFFIFVMLTEPRTAPLGRRRQIAYGAITGLLFSPTTHIGGYYFTPEIALLAGNAFAFLFNQRRMRRWAPGWA